MLKQYEKLQKEVDVKEKIEKSNAINQARLRLLKEREVVMAEAFAAAQKNLHTLGDVKVGGWHVVPCIPISIDSLVL